MLLLSPALAVIGGLFVGGLLIAATQSLGYFSPGGERGSRYHIMRRCSEIPGILAGIRSRWR
ncbi:MAG: hypothetical protein IPM55_04870 [Acidobacteria bacterium]|nr:hypothetical protein [Acidobacteriota bacterium]